MVDKYSLKWEEFQDNVCGTFKDIKDDEDFIDITLVSDDEKKTKASKVILAASSPILKNIIKSSKHPHPVIVLKGFKSSILQHIIDFIYFGEVDVIENDLQEFLDSSDYLKIKGLTEKNIEYAKNARSVKKENSDASQNLKCQGNARKVVNNADQTELPNNTSDAADELCNILDTQRGSVAQMPYVSKSAAMSVNESQTAILESHVPSNVISDNFDKVNPKSDSRIRSEKAARDNTISISELDLSVDIRDDPILKMFSTKGPSGFYCKTCGEFSNHGLTMKKHIQRNHMNDIQHSCRICGKGFSSRNRLTSHLMSEHKP